jgi:hypothetical protein
MTLHWPELDLAGSRVPPGRYYAFLTFSSAQGVVTDGSALYIVM